MNYKESIAYISSKKKFGSKLGLERINRLLYEMGNPQKELRIIHVAGTNGKGSVSSFITHGLIEAGYKTGTFTSPYIEQFEERIKINFLNINKDELASVCSFVKEKADKIFSDDFYVTEFEIITAIAFEYFKRKKIDIGVIEVGMGGRFDATNVIEKPEYSIITKIGLDHTQYLGDNIEKIAFEKAGIIKEGAKVFIINQENESIGVIKRVSKQKKTNLCIINPENRLIKSDIEGQSFLYKNIKLEIRLMGVHQRENAILAYEVLKSLGIDDEYIKRGLKKTSWPGRLEIVKRNPLLIIDGAHNIDGVRSLKNTIDEYFSNRKIIFIMAVMKDKDYISMVEEIKEYAKIFIALNLDNERALEAYKLAFVIKTYCNKTYISDKIEQAIDIALKEAKDDDVIIIFGSLYYLGDVKKVLKERKG